MNMNDLSGHSFEKRDEETKTKQGAWEKIILVGVCLFVVTAILLIVRFGQPKPMNRDMPRVPTAEAQVVLSEGQTSTRSIPAWWSPGGESVGLIDLSAFEMTDTRDPTYVQGCNVDGSCVWVLRTDADLPYVEPTQTPVPTAVSQPVVQPVQQAPVATQSPPCQEVVLDGTGIGTVCGWSPSDRLAQAQALIESYNRDQGAIVPVYRDAYESDASDPPPCTASDCSAWECAVYGTNCQGNPEPTVPAIDTPLLQE